MAPSAHRQWVRSPMPTCHQHLLDLSSRSGRVPKYIEEVKTWYVRMFPSPPLLMTEWAQTPHELHHGPYVSSDPFMKHEAAGDDRPNGTEPKASARPGNAWYPRHALQLLRRDASHYILSGGLLRSVRTSTASSSSTACCLVVALHGPAPGVCEPVRIDVKDSRAKIQRQGSDANNRSR